MRKNLLPPTYLRPQHGKVYLGDGIPPYPPVGFGVVGRSPLKLRAFRESGMLGSMRVSTPVEVSIEVPQDVASGLDAVKSAMAQGDYQGAYDVLWVMGDALSSEEFAFFENDIVSQAAQVGQEVAPPDIEEAPPADNAAESTAGSKPLRWGLYAAGLASLYFVSKVLK
jgi:hypothetical protein